MTTTPKNKPVCTECGSDDVTLDCIGGWDADKQEWIVIGELDNSDCNVCGGECSLKWVAASADEVPQ